MSSHDLTAKYGLRRNINTCINRAIRAELPGGNEAIDGLEQLRYDGNEPGTAWLRKVVDAMGAEIRKRYEIGEFTKGESRLAPPPPPGQ